MATWCYHFDEYGMYAGYVDEAGRYFDVEGTDQGALSSDGTLYDECGLRRRHVDVFGQLWDQLGACRGYLSPPPGAPTLGSWFIKSTTLGERARRR